MKPLLLILVGAAEAALVILIVLKFGWFGLLISLPILAALMFIGHRATDRWSRRNSLR